MHDGFQQQHIPTNSRNYQENRNASPGNVGEQRAEEAVVNNSGRENNREGGKQSVEEIIEAKFQNAALNLILKTYHDVFVCNDKTEKRNEDSIKGRSWGDVTEDDEVRAADVEQRMSEDSEEAWYRKDRIECMETPTSTRKMYINMNGWKSQPARIKVISDSSMAGQNTRGVTCPGRLRDIPSQLSLTSKENGDATEGKQIEEDMKR